MRQYYFNSSVQDYSGLARLVADQDGVAYKVLVLTCSFKVVSMISTARLQKTASLFLSASLASSLLAASPPAQAATACVTYEPPLAIGTVYGNPAGQTPGSVVLFSSNVIGSIENFSTGGPPFLGFARIENAPVAFSAGRSLRLNNISKRFHFAALPFVPKRVTFSFLDLGGTENLAVNGGAPFVGNISSAPASIGGLTVSTVSGVTPGGRRGTVTIKGQPLRDVTIGGQELWIDQVCASN